MEVVFLLTFKVKLVFLFVESFLETLLVLLHSIVNLSVVILLLHGGESVGLEQGLLELSSEAHAFIGVRLDLTIVFFMLAHLDVFLQLFYLPVL